MTQPRDLEENKKLRMRGGFVVSFLPSCFMTALIILQIHPSTFYVRRTLRLVALEMLPGKVEPAEPRFRF